MAFLIEDNAWREGIYQIETTDPVIGGPPNETTLAGVDNVPALQLACRTRYLKALVDGTINTNRALGGAGVRNDGGTLGFFTIAGGNGFVADAVNRNNGATISFDVSFGSFVLPNGKYNGQIVMLSFGTSNAAAPNQEVTMTAPFLGPYRNTSRVITAPISTESQIVRAGDRMILIWNVANNRWFPISVRHQILSGSGWRENDDGTATMWGASGTAATLPVAVTNTNYRVATAGATVSGKTTTGFTLSASSDWQVEGALLNYALIA